MPVNTSRNQVQGCQVFMADFALWVKNIPISKNYLDFASFFVADGF